MAPAQAPRPDRDKRIKSLLGFAEELQSQLCGAISSKGPPTLLQETEKQISQFPSTFGAAAAPRCDELDHIGTTLWNLCTRLRREHESVKRQDSPPILLLARVFAFLLLDCAHQSGRSDDGNVLRLMKVGLKAAKNCLERKQHSLALKVLEKLGGYEALLKKVSGPATQDGLDSHERLVAEYYVLRTALAWNQDQLDLAEHMYKKSTASKQCFDPNTAESLADVLYEMGKDLFRKQQYALAVKWLERAYEVLNGQELDRLSMDAGELRISVIQTSVKALLGMKTSEMTSRARDLIQLLESDVGDKLIVMLLKLEMLSGSSCEVFDGDAYSNILQKMTRTMPLNSNNFRLIMFHIRKLNDKSPNLACRTIDEFLNLRILEGERPEWIEKAIITRLWITVSQRDSAESLVALDDLLSTISTKTQQPLGPAAAHAAHTLLWKRIESNYSQGQYELADKWCNIALHKIFQNSGELNMARLSRKLILCALSKNDLLSAKEIFNAMSESARDEPMSRFLLYKVAVRSGDIDLAAECLAIVSASSTEDPTLMYACCLDAQQAGNKTQTLLALQLVLENYTCKPSAGLHFPSLIRLAIGLMESILDEPPKKDGSENSETIIERMCIAFEKASGALQKSYSHSKVGDSAWNVEELEWFSKNSYNIAIKHLATWHPRQSLRILTCSIIFIDCYPEDLSEQVSEDLSLRKMFCQFSASTALVSLARGEDNIEAQLQDYLTLRKHVANFHNLLQDKLDKMGGNAEQDLRRKLSILVAFDFEAACHLKAWNDLKEVVYRVEVCRSSQVYEVMADCLLCSQAPTQVLVTVLKIIINEAWNLESLDLGKLAKYMRCLFQVALSSDTEIAEQLLDGVGAHAQEAEHAEQPYPMEEIEWVATRAFNHAVDLYCAGDDAACQRWAAKAINVAHYSPDNGVLERLLQSKLVQLDFDGQ